MNLEETARALVFNRMFLHWKKDAVPRSASQDFTALLHGLPKHHVRVSKDLKILRHLDGDRACRDRSCPYIYSLAEWVLKSHVRRDSITKWRVIDEDARVRLARDDAGRIILELHPLNPASRVRPVSVDCDVIEKLHAGATAALRVKLFSLPTVREWEETNKVEPEDFQSDEP